VLAVVAVLLVRSKLENFPGRSEQEPLLAIAIARPRDQSAAQIEFENAFATAMREVERS
jgi:hypothetical protein